ncbi:hypothetical protein PSCICO_01380 [Pseudomonas cichorii]|nr:hypothetical protein PSCICO_01380 [Pseudomonas cichorii]
MKRSNRWLIFMTALSEHVVREAVHGSNAGLATTQVTSMKGFYKPDQWLAETSQDPIAGCVN